MITHFDRSTTKRLSERVQALVAKELVKEGVTVEFGGSTFAADSFTLKLKFGVPVSEEQKEEKERAEFTAWAFRMGFKPDDYGRVVRLRGKEYRVVGLRPAASKLPVVLETDRGARYIFALQDVLTALGR